MEAKDRIIVALDVSSSKEAIGLVEQLKEYVGCFKIGLQFINAMLRSIITPKEWLDAAENAQSIRELFSVLDGNIMWDGKFNDIPNTIAGASQEVVKIGVKMFNVHASAGKEAVAKAVANKGNALVLGVTVLTSIDENECRSIFESSPNNKVLQFAYMLCEQQADGIICSPKELEFLGSYIHAERLIRIVPGVRPEWAAKGDQKRVMAPVEAIKAGADYLVIGRPITNPPAEIDSPVEAAKKIVEEIEQALKEKGDEK